MPLPSLSELVQRTRPLGLPPRIVLYGPEGIGKTSWAAGAEAPVFIAPEDGFGLLEVDALVPRSWRDVLNFVSTLERERHSFKTVVIDTADWMEGMLHEHLCAQAACDSIEEIGGGYGKGYTAAVEATRDFVKALERLRAKGMCVVVLAHSMIRSAKNPEGADYDRYELRMHAKTASLWKDWADVLLFATYEVEVAVAGTTRRTSEARLATSRGKAIGNGERVVRTERTPAYDAKNRYKLPHTLPLSWAAFWSKLPKPAAPKRWTEKEQGAFFARLKEIPDAPAYEDIAAWCESLGRPRPSSMDDKARTKLLAYLASEEGGTTFWTWHGEQNPAEKA